MATIGERAFENYCNLNNLIFKKVGEADDKTPDYELFIGESKVIVEIKDLELNDEEKAFIERFDTHGRAISESFKPGTRIRHKVEKARQQLKRVFTGNDPAVLIMVDTRPDVVKGISPYELKVAMYGIETYELAVPKDFSPPITTGHKFGKDNKFRPNKNDHISGIGILDEGHLSIYHNIFAANPLSISILNALPEVTQYTLETEGNSDAFCDWKEVSS